MYVLCAFLVYATHAWGQLSLSADAYKLFTDKSETLKIGYLNYPHMAQKLTDWQNKSYAKLGIEWVLILKEKNGTKDTIAIQYYNVNGHIMERDTFTWDDRLEKHRSKKRYVYSLTGKKVRTIYTRMTLKPDSIVGALYYDDRGMIIKSELYSLQDTSTNYFEIDSNGIHKGAQEYRTGEGLTSESGYNYEFDKKGRVTKISDYTKKLADRETLQRRREDVERRRDDDDSDETPKRRTKDKYSDETIDKYSYYGGTTELVYDDQNRSIQIIRRGQCMETYYINKKSQVFQNYCCPLLKEDVKKDYYSLTKTTTIFDKALRTTSISTVKGYHRNLCEEEEVVFISRGYTYNTSGLLSEVINDQTKEKVFFHYLDKNKHEIH